MLNNRFHHPKAMQPCSATLWDPWSHQTIYFLIFQLPSFKDHMDVQHRPLSLAPPANPAAPWGRENESLQHQEMVSLFEWINALALQTHKTVTRKRPLDGWDWLDALQHYRRTRKPRQSFKTKVKLCSKQHSCIKTHHFQDDVFSSILNSVFSSILQ